MEALNEATALLQQEGYRAALAILGKLDPTPEVLWRSGQAWLGIGDLTRAITLLQPVQTALIDFSAATECAIDLAVAMSRMGRWQDAVNVLNGIVSKVKLLDDPRLHLLRRLAFGRAHYRAGNPDLFLNEWDALGPQLQLLGLKREWIGGSTSAVMAHMARGDWQGADAIINACMGEIAPNTYPRSSALLAYQKTIIHYNRDGFINEADLKCLLDAVEKTDSLDLRADASFLQGIYYWTRGDWPAARHAFEEARAVYLQVGNALDADLACIALARLDFDQADFAGALGWVARMASDMGSATAPHWAAGWAGLIEGWIHAALGNDAFAATRLESGWSHFSAMPQHDLAGFCALQRTGLRAISPDECQTWLARASEAAGQSSVPAYRILASQARGEHLLAMGDFAGARATLLPLLAEIKEAGVLPEQLRIATALIECDLRLAGDADLPALDARAAACLEDAAGLPELCARLALSRADISRRLGDVPQAMARLREASAHVRWMRALADDPLLSGAIAGNHETIFRRGISLSLELNDLRQAIAFIEGRRAQWLSRRVALHKIGLQARPLSSHVLPARPPASDPLAQRRRELHTATSGLLFGGKPATADQKAALQQSFSALQQAYAEINAHAMARTAQMPDAIGDAVVLDEFSIDAARAAFTARFGETWSAVQIEPAPDDDEAWLLMRLTPHTLSIETIAARNPLDRKCLTALSNPNVDWRRQMLAGDGNAPLRHRLSTWLKLDTWLPQDAPASHTLIFAGCDPFDRLPLAALPCAGHTLVQKAIIRHAFSWGMAAEQCMAHRSIPASPAALLVAPATFDGRHAPLPASLDEVESLRALWPNSAVLLSQQASVNALEEMNRRGELAHYDVLHFATHVQFDPRWSRASGLALHDGEVWLQDVLGWQLDAGVACISACEAARNMPAGGGESLGFETAMIAAGARNVISPQWPVGDIAAGKFIVAVMRHFQREGDLGAALAAIQRRHASTSDPFDWAGWRVSGMG